MNVKNYKKLVTRIIFSWSMVSSLLITAVKAEDLNGCKTRVRNSIFDENGLFKPNHRGKSKLSKDLDECVRVHSQLEGSLLYAHYLCKEQVKAAKPKAIEGCLRNDEYENNKILDQLMRHLGEVENKLDENEDENVLDQKSVAVLDHKHDDKLMTTASNTELKYYENNNEIEKTRKNTEGVNQKRAIIFNQKHDNEFRKHTLADLVVTSDISPVGITNFLHDSILNSIVKGRLVHREPSRMGGIFGYNEISEEIVGVCENSHFLTINGEWKAFDDYKNDDKNNMYRPYIIYFKKCKSGNCAANILGDPLHYAAMMDDEKTLKKLLEDDKIQENLKENINSVNSESFTPYQIAEKVNASQSLKETLIRNGASKKMLSPYDSITARPRELERDYYKPWGFNIRYGWQRLNGKEIDKINGLYHKLKDNEDDFLKEIAHINELLKRYDEDAHIASHQSLRKNGLITAINGFLLPLTMADRSQIIAKLPKLLKYFPDLSTLVRYISEAPIKDLEPLNLWNQVLTHIHHQLTSTYAFENDLTAIENKNLHDQLDKKHLINTLEIIENHFGNLASFGTQLDEYSKEFQLIRNDFINSNNKNDTKLILDDFHVSGSVSTLNTTIGSKIEKYLSLFERKDKTETINIDPNLIKNIQNIKNILNKLDRSRGNENLNRYSQANKIIDRNKNLESVILRPIQSMKDKELFTDGGSKLLIETSRKWDEFRQSNPPKQLYFYIARTLLKKEDKLEKVLSKNESKILDHLEVLVDLEEGLGKDSIFEHLRKKLSLYINLEAKKYIQWSQEIKLDTDNLNKHSRYISKLLERTTENHAILSEILNQITSLNRIIEISKIVKAEETITQTDADLLIEASKKWDDFVKGNPSQKLKNYALSTNVNGIKNTMLNKINQSKMRNRVKHVDLKIFYDIEKGLSENSIFYNVRANIHQYLNNTTTYFLNFPYITFSIDKQGQKGLIWFKQILEILVKRSSEMGHASKDRLNNNINEIEDIIQLSKILASRPRNDADKNLESDTKQPSGKDEEKSVAIVVKNEDQSRSSADSGYFNWISNPFREKSISEVYKEVLSKNLDKDSILKILGNDNKTIKTTLASIDEDGMTLLHHLARDLYKIYKNNPQNGFSYEHSKPQFKLLFMLWPYLAKNQSQWSKDKTGFSFSDYIINIVEEEYKRFSKLNRKQANASGYDVIE